MTFKSFKEEYEKSTGSGLPPLTEVAFRAGMRYQKELILSRVYSKKGVPRVRPLDGPIIPAGKAGCTECQEYTYGTCQTCGFDYNKKGDSDE